MLAPDDPSVRHCDFCYSTKVRWRYHVEGSVVMGEGQAWEIAATRALMPDWQFHIEGNQPDPQQRVLHQSSSDWLACEKCAAFIEDGDVRGLAARATRAIGERQKLQGVPIGVYPEIMEKLKESILEVHAQFMGAWTGRRSPVTES